MYKESKATVRCPGSCGELVQGTASGTHFLVTCPVDVYSTVTVTLSDDPLPFQEAGEKTVQAVQKTLETLGLAARNFRVSVDSDLPRSKGMASSSADIGAACLAAALAAGAELTLSSIADIALSIEPTDGIFLPGITMFDHVRGEVRRSLGEPPPLVIAIFDAGGEVDTVGFNRRADLLQLNKLKEAQVLVALQMVEAGLQRADCGLIGAGATLSALANQRILPKPGLESIIEISRGFGAVGVNAAHSGTMIGVFFDPARAEGLEQFITAVHSSCPETRYCRTARLIGGGLSVVEVCCDD